MSVPIDDGHCFACGPENADGLHLRFERDGDGVVARTTLDPRFQGWQGIAHGGIAMTLLDEAMAHAAAAAGCRGVTASVSIRFRRPIPLCEALLLRGRVTWKRRNVLGVVAEVHDANGTLLVHGDGHFVSQGSIADVADRRRDYRAEPSVS